MHLREIEWKSLQENNQRIREKNGGTEHNKGNKRVPGKVATTHTEDGHTEVT